METLLSWKLRTSSSIYNFEEKALKTWKIEKIKPNDWNANTVFFGLYHLGDFESFIKHKGKRIVIWAGGDIRNLLRGYAFSDGKELWKSKLFSFIPWHWIFRIYKAEHFVENEDEQRKLASMGIKAKIVPTFLEDINEFPVCYKPSDRPQVYISARKGQKKEYGVYTVMEIAHQLPNFTFHIYGIEGLSYANVIFHGNVPQKQFNDEIKGYQCGLRTNLSDGASEVMIKCFLNGGYPITRIKYDGVDSYNTEEELVALLKKLPEKKEPNYKTREMWIKKFNNFPFLKK